MAEHQYKEWAAPLPIARDITRCFFASIVLDLQLQCPLVRLTLQTKANHHR